MNLNLTRKWRSKNFDQIIGQAMPIRMLKNSLYLNQLFPVYLFCGQYGCGKTSTARIFATAINCANIDQFRAAPRNHSIPCATCASCLAMAQGNHPDFYEIDAASHTGVDTIRQIIEAATLLPLLGHKKIYLIDEAHMLSKAAFNALLKILEEPPASVLFILATTDEQKILETVQSRCFKLFFTPVKQSTIVDHLASICDQEKIGYQRPALELIAQECAGSVRDAINLLEQMRFSSSTITPQAVMHILGRIDDSSLLQILELVFRGNVSLLLKKLYETKWYEHKADLLWTRLLVAIRALIWSKYGISSEEMASHSSHITALAQRISLPFLYNIMNTLHAHEHLFMRTTSQHTLLELILLQLCYKKGDHEGESGTMLSSPTSNTSEASPASSDNQVEKDTKTSAGHHNAPATSAPCYRAHWSQFIHAVGQLDEQLLFSIMKQAQFITFDHATQHVKAQCAQGGAFFKGIIEDTQRLWQPMLKDIFGTHATLQIDFGAARGTTPATPTISVLPQLPPSSVPQRVALNKPYYKAAKESENRHRQTQAPYLKQPLAVTSESWPISTLLLHHFPGTVYTTQEHR
jgi:DNA polymerase-3 subunit gamma/tau